MSVHPRWWLCALANAAVSLALGGQQAAAQCEYTILHTLPDGPVCGAIPYNPLISAIADDGTVCGTAGAGMGCQIRPFIWSPGDATITLLPLPAGMSEGRGLDINESHVVVGFCRPSVSGSSPRPCMWIQGNAILLPTPPGMASGQARAVNSAGVIVGYAQADGGTGPPHAMTWQNGGYTDIHPARSWFESKGHDINDSGTTVGEVSMGLQTSVRGFIRTTGETTILPPIAGGISSRAAAVNSLGVVAGTGDLTVLSDPEYGARSFLWVEGAMGDLGYIPGLRDCFIRSMNDAGQVVGGCGPGASALSIVWKSGHLGTVIVNGVPWPFPMLSINDEGLIAVNRSILLPLPKPAYDIDQNCIVNVNDLLPVIVNWGKTESPADCNQDGIVNSDDLLLVILNWG